jgi:hypothetical protein
MVWHVFKKDVRLLWPLSLAVVVVGALCALRTIFEGHFYQPVLERLTFFLPYLLDLGIAIVAVTAVHQDALSDSQEDWLIRPLLRRDVALAKVLFVLLTVNAPLMIIDVLQQLALHFPLSVSIGVAASRALVTAFMFSLPGLMLGAVTRSLVDAFVFGTASAIGFVLLIAVATSTLSPSVLGLGGAAGMRWISLWAAGGVIVIGSAATLTFQYSTRRARVARSIGLAAVFAAVFTVVLLPGTATLAIQESLWGPPNSDGIRLSFDPASQVGKRGGRSGQEPRLGYGIGPPISPATAGAMAALVASVDRQIEKVGLPLTISGMHPDDILVADRIDLRLVAMNGEVLYEGAGVCTREPNGAMCSSNRLEVWGSSAGGQDVPSQEQLNVPIGLYRRIKDEPVRVEVTYALSRFVARSTQMINATGDLKALSELGSCATRIDGDEDEVELGCLTDVGVPSCAGVVLEDPQTNRRNPELHLCNPQYGPFRRRGGLEDAVDRSHLSIPFRDLSGLVHYPVDSAAISHARIDVTVYDPVGHFRATVTVPDVRLADWALPPAESTAPMRN